MTLTEAENAILKLFREIESEDIFIGVGQFAGGKPHIVLIKSGDTWEDMIQIINGSWRD